MKKSLKKGGIADVVTLVIIVGIVLALVVAVVVPFATKTREAGSDNAKAFDSASFDSIKTQIGTIS